MSSWWIKKPLYEEKWVPLEPAEEIELPRLVVGKINYYLYRNLLSDIFGAHRVKKKYLRIYYHINGKYFDVQLDDIISIKKIPWSRYEIKLTSLSYLLIMVKDQKIISSQLHHLQAENKLSYVCKIGFI